MGAEVMDQILRRRVFLLPGQLVNGPQTVYIGHKTKPERLIGLGELVVAGRIQHDPEAVNDTVSMRFHDPDHLVHDPVESLIPILGS